MRLLLGSLLLFALFAVATRWHDAWTDELRAERDLALERANAAASGDGTEVRVIVGRQSGVRPRAGTTEPAGVASAPSTAAITTAAAETSVKPSEPAVEREFELVVQRGQSLSTICRGHYGTARQDIVSALAAYNGLSDPDRVREGMKIKLPPMARLSSTQR